MITDPTLLNPRRVLHTLNHSSALFVLMALMMDDCPRPCSEVWLCTRAGKSPPTVRGALALLYDGGVVREARPGHWELTDGVKQLPLPLRLLGQPDIYDGELDSHNQPLFTRELAPHNQPSLDRELAPDNQPLTPDEKIFSREKKFFSSDHDDDDLRSFPDQELDHHHHSSNSAREKKFFSPDAILDRIGMNGVNRQALRNAPLPVLLGWHWATQSDRRRYKYPPGFIVTVLLKNEPPDMPPTPFLTLATTWLQMSSGEREQLIGSVSVWDGQLLSRPINGHDIAESLEPEFYPELDAAALEAFLSIRRQCPNELSTACG